MTADASIPDGDKKELMQELNEAINSTPRLEHLENVELVKSHRAEMEGLCSNLAVVLGPDGRRRGQLMLERAIVAAKAKIGSRPAAPRR